ncbi:MAG: hypothetical protein ACI4NM_02960 [Bullifex sp.]
MLSLLSDNVLTAVKMGFTAWALLVVSLGAVYAVLKVMDILQRKRNKE